jgi:thiamine-monophosphate kinase
VALSIATGGGEDYELLAAVAPGMDVGAVRKLTGELGVELTRIGTVEAGAGVEWVGARGEVLEPPASGFDHFAEEE